MKRLIFISLLPIVVFFSCNNSGGGGTTVLVDTPYNERDTSKITCDFGIPKSKMGIVKRPLYTNEQMKLPVESDKMQGKRNTKVIYIDFNGYDATKSYWNYSSTPLILSGSGLTTEQQKIVTDSVKKDFYNFDVLVTYVESAYNAAQQNKRVRIVPTESWEWYGKCGGVSYINSFTWGDNTPAFVFTSLLNYNLRSIAKAISHEAGHTLSLQHQAEWNSSCQLVSQYRGGAIMGYFYTPVAKWVVGANQYSCTAIQDDASIIKQTLRQ